MVVGEEGEAPLRGHLATYRDIFIITAVDRRSGDAAKPLTVHRVVRSAAIEKPWLDRYRDRWILIHIKGLPWWLSGKEPACQCRRHGFHLWVGKIPWRRKWQPTPVFLSGKSHGQRSLASYSSWGRKRVGNDLTTKRQQQYIKRVCINLSLGEFFSV